MRHDMFKVIVERPRGGSNTGPGHFYRAAKTFKLDEDLEVDDQYTGRKLPTKGVGNNRAYKRLNENLNPLYRFLLSRVGRPWDDVYSEICEHLDTGSTVKQHVRDHIDDFIYVITYVSYDGEIWARHRQYGSAFCVDDRQGGRYGALLYVHPETGLVCKAKVRKRGLIWREEREEATRKEAEKKVYVNKHLRFEKKENKRGQWSWFRDTYIDLPKSNRYIFDKYVWPSLSRAVEANEARKRVIGSYDKHCVHYVDKRKFTVVTDNFLAHDGDRRARSWRATHAPQGVIFEKSQAASKGDIKKYGLK